jgi:hypothetical protein
MVEQWTENPCVPGSIPGGTTTKTRIEIFGFSVLWLNWFKIEVFENKKPRFDSKEKRITSSPSSQISVSILYV